MGLQPFFLGDILSHADDAGDASLLVGVDGSRQVKNALISRFADDLHMALSHTLPAADQATIHIGTLFMLLIDDKVSELMASHLIFGMAQNFFPCRVDVADGTGIIQGNNDHRCIFTERLKSLFAPAQRILGGDDAGDVPEDDQVT